MAAVLGAGVGVFFGSGVAPLGEIGALLLGLIRVIAGPLLFFAVLDAFLRAEMSWSQVRRFGVFVLINACFAVAIGLELSNGLEPGRALSEAARGALGAAGELEKLSTATLTFGGAIRGLLPKSLLHPFLENSIPGIVMIAIALGVSFRKVKALGTFGENIVAVEKLSAVLLRAIEFLISGVVRIVPVAVFGVIAKIVGEQGFSPFLGLPLYVGVVLSGLFLQVAVVYQLWLKVVARRGLRQFWRDASEPVIYALGASSSLVTLPVTLKTLDRMGVSRGSSRLVACVGTNLNNDGILLYEALAVLVVAQAHGIHLSFSQQVWAAVICVLASVGIGGIPDAGLISLSVVLTTVGMPIELLPLLLSVDWLLSRARAATNVVCDLVGSCVLDSQSRKK